MNDSLTWIPLGPLAETSTDFSSYSNDIGVYRAILNGEVVYVGKATELNNGGFRKRLRDYTRSSSSARNYPAGESIYHHRNEIYIEIRIFKRDFDELPKIENFEKELIRQLRPIWNKQERER